jgi:hypothetical protein
MYAQIAGVTRAEDYVGMLGDGNCYILFTQADRENTTIILSRLAQRGILCQLVFDEYLPQPEAPISIVDAAVVNWPLKKTGPLHLSDDQANILTEGNGTHRDGPSTPEAHSAAASGDHLSTPEAYHGAISGDMYSVSPILEYRSTDDLEEDQDAAIPGTGEMNLSERTEQRLHRLWHDLSTFHDREQPAVTDKRGRKR